MKKSILFVFVLLAVFSMPVVADEIPGMVKSSWGADGTPAGIFCNVEKTSVCVLARTEDDCTKLGGKKVDACSASQDKEK